MRSFRRRKDGPAAIAAAEAMAAQDSGPGIGLADVLQALGEDIDASQARLAGDQARPFVDQATVEVAVSITKGGGVDGRVGIQVLPTLGASAGARFDYARESAHKVTLVLKPGTATSLPLLGRRGQDGGQDAGSAGS